MSILQSRLSGGSGAPDVETSSAIEPALPQAVGYVVVVVVGFFIAFVMVLATYVLKKTAGEDNRKTEMFMTANRSVRTGLTTSAVVSSWLWSTAMLGSTLVGYNFGVAGPFWFAAGSAIAALTGMHIIAATFLLPAGVVLYTFVGGIKATFLTDYFHTFVIAVVICFFTIKTFTTPEITSIGHMWELIATAGALHPVQGNQDGSYLTMTSKGAILFGIIHILANFGLVIMDTGFFVKAFSAAPQAVVPAYIAGGIAYFAIPWCLGTLMSFSALSLEGTPRFPTFPRRMTSTEVSNGLVLPYAAIAIAGKGGAVAVLLIVFMAVTSTISAQVISVSSIISFDIYRQYVNKNATDADVIRWSHIGVVFFGLFSACFSTALHYGNVDLGWTLYMLGVLTCPGIFPTVFTILWKKQSRTAAIVSPLLGLATGIAVWLGTAHALTGAISVASTGETLPCVYGTVASALSPGLYSVIISYARPDNYDWAEFRKEKLALDGDTNAAVGSTSASRDEEEAGRRASYEVSKAKFKYWGKIAAIWSLATFFGHWVLWPLPIYASKYVFSKNFFSAWVVVSIIWVWGTMFVVGFYPIIDGRKQILQVWRGRRNHKVDGNQHNNGNRDNNPNNVGNWIWGGGNSNGNSGRWNGSGNDWNHHRNNNYTRRGNEHGNDSGNHKHGGNDNRYNSFSTRPPWADYILTLLRQEAFNPETLRDLVSATTYMLELAWLKRQITGMTERAIVREFQIPLLDCVRLQEMSRKIIDISLMPDIDGDIPMSGVDGYPLLSGQNALGPIALGHEAIGRIIGLGV
ncbi:hypothetical protein VTH06DRAFT_6955 [Thermothelomyces fergusii]